MNELTALLRDWFDPRPASDVTRREERRLAREYRKHAMRKPPKASFDKAREALRQRDEEPS